MNQADQPQADEVDLRNLFLKMWATRTPAFIALLVVTLGYWGIWAAAQWSAPTTYSRLIQFTFPEAADGLYPNGSPFRIADLTAPGVLSRVHDANRLAERGISEEQFVQGFNILSHIPDYDLIIQKYMIDIDHKKTTRSEISHLNEDMASELEQASSHMAKLSFTPYWRTGTVLHENDIEKILLDVPRLWAETAADVHGAIYPDTVVYRAETFEALNYESLDYPAIVDLLEDNFTSLLDAIDILMTYPNGTVMKDEKTGNTLPDLQRLVMNVVNYELAAISAPIQMLGIAKDRRGMALYFRKKLLRLERELVRTQMQGEAARDILFRDTRTPSGKDDASQASSDNWIAGTPHLDTGFLSKLIALAQQGEDLLYRQSLSDKILDHGTAAAEIEQDILRMRAILDGFAGPPPDAEEAGRYIALFEQGVPAVLTTVQEHAEAAHRIRAALIRDRLAYGGTLYRTTGSVRMEITGGMTLSTLDLLLYPLLAGTALFGIMFTVMARRWMRERG